VLDGCLPGLDALFYEMPARSPLPLPAPGGKGDEAERGQGEGRGLGDDFEGRFAKIATVATIVTCNRHTNE
jgi:hypothetical protein